MEDGDVTAWIPASGHRHCVVVGGSGPPEYHDGSGGGKILVHLVTKGTLSTRPHPGMLGGVLVLLRCNCFYAPDITER